MVSPRWKGGYPAVPSDVAGLPVAPDGNSVGFRSNGQFVENDNTNASGGANTSNDYLAYRTASGWSTTSLMPPGATMQDVNFSNIFVDLSPDLSLAATCGEAFSGSQGALEVAVCARQAAEKVWSSTPGYEDLAGSHSAANDIYIGGSADFAHVFFASIVPLLPADVHNQASGNNAGSIYEVAGLNSNMPILRLVSIGNDGNIINASANIWLGGVMPACTGGSAGETSAYQAISTDGDTVYFSTCPTSTNVMTLFARIDNSGTEAHTVDVSNPAVESDIECTSCSSTPAPADYKGASSDGSRVFFTTTQQLQNADTDATTDLYEYNFYRPAGRHIVQLSAGGLGDPTPGVGANVQGVVRSSADGSHVYFVATGLLTTIPNGAGQTAMAGADNLYAVDTETDQIKFVAELCSGTNVSGSREDPACLSSSDGALWSGDDSKRQAQTTPDGRYLVFDTYGQLSSEDTDNAADVYRYDFQTGQLVRVSHGAGPGGATDFGNNGNTNGENATIAPLQAFGNATGRAAAGAYAAINDFDRAVSSDGSYIIFTTPEQLQNNDANGGGGSNCLGSQGTELLGCDVYVWHEGAVSLISSGQGTEGVTGRPGISASGQDVFFATDGQLVGQDTDQLGDIYDARVGGGFPYSPLVSCAGEEECRGSGSQAPLFGSPASLSVAGGGNLAPAVGTSLPPAASKPVTKPKTLTRKQKLKRALRACGRKPKKQRAACKRWARKRYAGKSNAKKSNWRGR